MSSFDFTCPTCSCTITLNSALPGEQICCPECNYLFASPPPIGVTNDLTAPAETLAPEIYQTLNAPPPLPVPESPLLGTVRMQIKSTPTNEVDLSDVAFSIAKIGACALLLIIVVGVVIFSIRKAVVLFSDTQNEVSVSVQNIIENNRNRTRVRIDAGDVIIVDDKARMSSVEIQCNNGLIITADWQRNPYNEFGYNIFKPKVNRTTNETVVMILARRVIANYLNGEYD